MRRRLILLFIVILALFVIGYSLNVMVLKNKNLLFVGTVSNDNVQASVDFRIEPYQSEIRHLLVFNDTLPFDDTANYTIWVQKPTGLLIRIGIIGKTINDRKFVIPKVEEFDQILLSVGQSPQLPTQFEYRGSVRELYKRYYFF